MDAVTSKPADCQRSDKRRNSTQSSGNGAALRTTAGGTEPDNKYYEVEAILEGPRKRREHLFKYCYKVRWKGYGPEADTWQPIADLANVQDMIEDYKKDRALKQRDKMKKKPTDKDDSTGIQDKLSQKQVSSSSDEDASDGDHQYDPIYGTVKDKFWKDLELGRHQNHELLFSGDMYSKVKGCRRAAHAEAVASIQRQHPLIKPHHVSAKLPSAGCKSPVTPAPTPSPEQLAPSLTLSSLSENSLVRSSSLKGLGSKPTTASRIRKRASDPFSARGYMSNKRSRRSREVKGSDQSPDDEQHRLCSTTSESQDSHTSLVNAELQAAPETETTQPAEEVLIDVALHDAQPEEPVIASVVNSCGLDEVVAGADLEGNDSSTEKCVNKGQEDKDTAMQEMNNEIMKIECKDFDMTQKHLELTPSIEMTDKDVSLVTTLIDIPAPASENEPNIEMSCDQSGDATGGTLLDPGVSQTLSPKQSPLGSNSEATGAVERSHDEECLWNGACNRSDCKSNRRRNMKSPDADTEIEKAGDNVGCCQVSVEEEEGHDRDIIGISEDGENVTDLEVTSLQCPTKAVLYETSVISEQHGEELSSSISTNTRLLLDNSMFPKGTSVSVQASVNHMETPSQSHQFRNPSPDSARTVHKMISPNSIGVLPVSSGPTCRSLFSSYQIDSDSSFEESPIQGTSLSREAVSNSFDHHAKSFQSQDPVCPTNDSLLHSSRVSCCLKDLTKASKEEGPVLCSTSSVLSFTRQDSGFSGGSESATPGEHHGGFTIPSPTGMNLASPGKENFGTLSCRPCLPAAGGAYKIPVSLADAQQHISFNLNSQCQPLSIQRLPFPENSDTYSNRKWTGVSQHLDKIPSLNFRESDLDRQISSLTCEELEDFIEQGEERCLQKELAYISNADLLQAVNLNKADIVQIAFRQSASAEHKLDFEQPDSSGVTLLMRAVLKGNIAIVEMLLEYGVNVNAQQLNGTTALIMAAEQNSVCLVALLLKYGANGSLYTVQADCAETALMKAIKKQHVEIVSLMLRVGVNTSAPTCSSLSALELAVERRNPQIERMIRIHCHRLNQAFQARVQATLEGTAELVEPLFPINCFPLRESHQFVVQFNSNIHPVVPGEGFLLFIAHTKITDRSVRCRFHGGCPIGSVTLNGILQSPLTKEVNFVTSCHPIVAGCNTLVIHKMADYTSKAKLVVQAFRARLLPC